MDTRELKQLIVKARRGDVHAFGELYSTLSLELYRFALYTLKHPSDAEDAVQNASIIAFKNIGNLKKADSFKSWYFKILYNECMKIVSGKEKTHEISCEDFTFSESQTVDVTGDIEAKEILDSLSEPDRSIVILSVFDKCTSKEIAEILGMKEGTVRSRLSRCFAELRIQLRGAEK